MKRIFLLLAIAGIIFSSLPIFPLASPASDLTQLKQDADVATQAGNYPKAIEIYQQILALQRQQKDRSGEGWTLFNLGWASQFAFQYQEALSYYEQALRLKQATQDRLGEIAALQALGGIYGLLGQFEKGLSYLEQALALIPPEKNLVLEIGTRMSMNSIYVQLGLYDKMLENGQQLMLLGRKMGNPFYEALALNSLGLASRMLGQTGQAAGYYDQALAIQRQRKDKTGEVATLVGLGMFYKDTLQQPGKALDYFQQALAIVRESKDRVSESAHLGVIGVLYNDLKQYDQAVAANEQALQIGRELRNPMLIGAAVLGLGATYDNLGQGDKALPLLQEAQQIYQKLGMPSILWIVQRTLGKTEAGRGAADAAIFNYEQSLVTIEGMRAGLAEQEVRTSFARNKLFVYDEFIELLKTLHDKNPAAGYDRKSLEIFERKQGRAFLEEVGKSGAKYFCGVPADVKTKETELENRLVETQAFLRQYRSSPEPGKFAEKIKGLDLQLTQIKSEQQALQDEIQRRCPDYYALKYPQPATLTELQQNVLKPGELMLVYGVMDKATYLWMIGKDKFGLFSLGAGEKDLSDKVGDFRLGVEKIMQAIQQGQTETALNNLAAASRRELSQSGEKLAAFLLPAAARPLLVDAQTLYVVPTGPLYGLPFEALTLPSLQAEPAATYLIEQYAVAYLSSASLLKTLRQTAAQKQIKAKYPLLAFANPVYSPVTAPVAPSGGSEAKKKPVSSKAPGPPSSLRTRAYLDYLGGSFAELPDTAEEAREIKQILQAPDQSQPLQMQAAASRSQVLRLQKENLLENYRYLVFACHGVLPGEVDRIRQPALVLSHPDPQTKGDGYLTMADIFGLKLNADLVSLSACNTGRGQLEKGEGVVGLTRAFMYAGTPALSVTLWSVESGSARRLNTGLYQHLEAKDSRAQALRRIKQEMIRGNNAEIYRHPFFWAPLVLFGEGGS